MRLATIVAVFLLISGSAASQMAAPPDSDETGSRISRILRSSGTAILREFQVLPSVVTMQGQDIQCQIVVAINLAEGAPNSWKKAVGLSFTLKEEYSSRFAYLDPDEIDGLIAFLELINADGEALLANSGNISPQATSSTRELFYSSKDGAAFAASAYQGEMYLGARLTSTADWAHIGPASLDRLEMNLLAAREVARIAME